MREETKRIWANLLLLLTGAIWGGGFVVVKNALDAIPVNYLLLFRFLIGALGLSFSLFNKKSRITKELAGQCAIIGLLMYGAFAAQTYGLAMTTAGKSALITAVYVVLVPLMGWYAYKKRPPAQTLAAACVMLLGIALLSWTGGGQMNLGDALTLLCGVLYALEIMAVDKYGAGVDIFQFSCLQYIFASLYAAAPALLLEAFPREWNAGMFFALGYSGIAATLVAMTLMNIGIRYASPNYASLLISTESAFGCLFGVIFLNEALNGRMALGCALIIAALVLSQARSKPRKAE